MENFYN